MKVHSTRLIALVAIATSAFIVGFSLRALEDTGNGARAAAARAGKLSQLVSIAQYEQADKTHTLLFAGDIMLSRAVGKQMEKNGDYTFPFQQIAEVTRAADFAFANLENPVSSRGENQGSIYSFRADPRATEGLARAGFDAVSLANNHIFDYGADAFTDTLTLLGANSIAPVGAGRNYQEANAPYRFALGDTRFALLAYTNLYPASLEAGRNNVGISNFDEEKIYAVVKAVKQQTDIVIVSLHWGQEYQTTANNFQKRVAHALVDAGADLVIGAHPHVVQEIEQYKNGYIAYSLGNFVFDQNFSKETMEGLMLKVTVRVNNIERVEQLPIRINPAFQPELAVP